MVKIGHPDNVTQIMSEESWPQSKSSLDVIEEYFYDEWLEGAVIQKVVITQRLYQTSPTSTQA